MYTHEQNKRYQSREDDRNRRDHFDQYCWRWSLFSTMSLFLTMDISFDISTSTLVLLLPFLLLLNPRQSSTTKSIWGRVFRRKQRPKVHIHLPERREGARWMTDDVLGEGTGGRRRRLSLWWNIEMQICINILLKWRIVCLVFLILLLLRSPQ